MSRPDRLLSPRFVLIIAVGLCYFVALGALIPTVPLLVKHHLGGGDTAVGIAVGAFSFGAVVLRPWTGRMGDRLGRRILIVSGPALVGVSVAALHLLADHLPALVGARFVGGLGEAAMFVGAGTMVTDLAPEHRRGEALSYWSIAIYGGLAFGPAIGEAVLGTDENFGRVWTVCTALLFGAAVLALFIRETLVRVPGGDPAPPVPLFHRKALGPGFVLFLVMIGLAGFMAFVPLYVGEIGLSESRGVFLVYGGAVLAVRIFGARIPDRFGPRPTATVACLAAAAGLTLIAAIPHVAGLIAGSVVFAFGMSLLFPAISTLAMTGIPAGERGSVMGTVSTFFDAANGLGAPLLGGVAFLTGYRGAFLGGAVACVLGFVLLRTRVSDRDGPVSEADVALAVATTDGGPV